MSNLFYVLSLNERYAKSTYLVFWRPNANGYACPLSWSGLWTGEEIAAQANYLNDGKSTLAVPAEAVDLLAVRPVPGEIDGDAGPVVINIPENVQALRRAA